MLAHLKALGLISSNLVFSGSSYSPKLGSTILSVINVPIPTTRKVETNIKNQLSVAFTM